MQKTKTMIKNNNLPQTAARSVSRGTVLPSLIVVSALLLMLVVSAPTTVHGFSTHQPSHCRATSPSNARKTTSPEPNVEYGDAPATAGTMEGAHSHQTRRDHVLSTLRTVAAVGASVAFTPLAAFAADPITTKEIDNVGSIIQRAGRPKPLKVLRRKLNLEFAVLLMRSSYMVLDELDCVAMDQFQRDFFLIRQAEYENYLKLVGPGLVQQGDLTDPYYFDLISLAQHEAMERDLTKNPPMVFTEQQPVDQGEGEPQRFDAVLVKRDPFITNDKLVAEHGRRVGSMILNRLQETFSNSAAAIPKIEPNSRPSADVFVGAVKQMVNLFLINGFAFGANVSVLGGSSTKSGSANSDGFQISIELDSPATLWGGRVLQYQRSSLDNDYVRKVTEEMARRAGYAVKSSSIKHDGKTQRTIVTLA